MTRPRRKRGLLVALEGIDGTGKSTLARGLAAALRRRGVSVALRREPADPRLGRLAQEASVRDPWTGAVYFTVDRHLALPALRRDLSRRAIVLTDRSFYSTLAYQGSALPPKDRARLERIQAGASVPPDRVLLLELPPSEAMRRLVRRVRLRAPLERRKTLERVDRAYRILARRRGWTTLDARRPPRALLREALGALGVGDRRSRARRAGRRR
ncbi:MAG TPA: dTMP kinase [Thermoplasmata archaeon]|nr:dTMP kinase [Thermoplasmata archaeon]